MTAGATDTHLSNTSKVSNMASKSNLSAAGGKVPSQPPSPSDWNRPYEGFPLSYHPPSKRLYKKILGRRRYFGYAVNWQEALEKFQRERMTYSPAVGQ